MVDLAERLAEQAKYVDVYTRPEYRMHGQRMEDAFSDLAGLPCRGSLLDVGCGRGEAMRHAAKIGFDPVHGVEVVPELVGGKVSLGEAHALPFDDRSFDVVTMLDVLEHLLPGDDEAACRELSRVARKHVLLTANNLHSVQPDGTELHVNRRKYQEWNGLLIEWFAPWKVTWLRPERDQFSQTWRIDFAS